MTDASIAETVWGTLTGPVGSRKSTSQRLVDTDNRMANVEPAAARIEVALQDVVNRLIAIKSELDAHIAGG